MELDFSGIGDDQLVMLIRAALQEVVHRHPAVQATVHAAMLDESERLATIREAQAAEAVRLKAEARAKLAREAVEALRRDPTSVFTPEERRGIMREARAAEKARLRTAENARLAHEVAQAVQREQQETERLRAEERQRAAEEAAQRVRETRGQLLDETERERIESETIATESVRIRVEERRRIAREAREAAQRDPSRAPGAANVTPEDRAWIAEAAALVGLPPEAICINLIQSHQGRRLMISKGADPFAWRHLIDWQDHPYQACIAPSLDQVKSELREFCAKFDKAHPRPRFIAGARFEWPKEGVKS